MSAWPSAGIYTDVTPEQYFGLTQIDGKRVRSKSMLCEFDKNPRAFNDGYGKRQTDSMRKGSLFDCLLTSPETFGRQFVVSPYAEYRTNEAKQWRADQEELGLTPIKPSEFSAAQNAVCRVIDDPRWREMTAGAPHFQVAMRADVEGMPFKGLVDLVPDEDESAFGDALVDVKRCGTMEDVRAICKTAARFGYGQQGGLYRALWQLATGKKRPRFILFVVPMDFTDPSAEICVLDLGRGILDNGAQQIIRMNRRLLECEATGIWPGKFDGIIEVDQSDETWDWQEKLPELEEAAA
jgi:hypothetical protein